MKRTNGPPEPEFLDVHGVARRYGVKVVTIWTWTRKGRFPQPTRLSPGCSRWSRKKLEAWEAEREEVSGTSRAEFEENERLQQMKEARRAR